MALNPPLLPDGRPAGLAGEYYVLERRGVAAAIDTADPRHRTLKAAGSCVLLTTTRLVVLPPPHTVNFRAFDVPLQGLSGETFVQPIFGANHLDFSVACVPGRELQSAGPIKVSLTFNEGGCNRFLRVFFALVERNRAAVASAAAAAALQAPLGWAAELEAFVDPSDPSVIYVTAAPASAAPQPPPAPGGAAFAPAPFYAPQQPNVASYAQPQPTFYAPQQQQQQPAYYAQQPAFAPAPYPQQQQPAFFAQPAYAAQQPPPQPAAAFPPPAAYPRAPDSRYV